MEKGYYFVYITTNPRKTAFYMGVTNDLRTRIYQHYENHRKWKTFAGRYHYYRLIFYELHEDINQAFDREKEIKNLSRKKKGEFISNFNPGWYFYDLRDIY